MDKVEELLTRGVDRIYPTKDELENVLRSRKKLTIYEGFDPTSSDLHIGHLIGLKKLSQWQKLGHKIIFLIGDFTGMVGDPTGKDKTRLVLTKEQVLENAKTYRDQASKIIDFEGENPAVIKYNSEWLAKLSAAELIHLTTYLSYQQVIERDMFQKRLKNNMDIALNEFLYPFMQGYDSVAMDVDVEIGGTDQTFNMLMGRTLMRKIKRKDKFVMTTPLLEDSQGKKVGKTEGNVIALTDNPIDLYRKIMALGDDVVIKGLEYLTDISMDKILEIEKKIKNGENPIAYKKLLAFEITKQLNDEKSAKGAQDNFERVVQNKELPTDISNFAPTSGASIAGAVSEWSNMSSSEVKRIINQGGLQVEGEKIDYQKAKKLVKEGSIIKMGKKSPFRIRK